MWLSQRRRDIPVHWAGAAIRLQRCPEVQLAVRCVLSNTVTRTRGALTGNPLAAWFGKLIVEDTFLAAEPSLESLHFSFMDVRLQPMAWSDNIAVFANSIGDAASALTSIATHLELRHLRVKDGSQCVVPASTVKMSWPNAVAPPFTYPVVAETKCLGYYISCNGDNSRCQATLLGGLRGCIARLGNKYNTASAYTRAKWWKTQFHGFVGFYAAFIGLNVRFFEKVGILANAAARKVGGMSPLNNSSQQLKALKTSHDICVQHYFVKTIVSWLGHCFRHPNHLVSKLLSLPLDGRLTEHRLLSGRSLVSEVSLRVSEFFSDFGVQVEPELSGPLNLRNHPGRPFRWGQGWFGAIRDGGVGWRFSKDDKDAIAERVCILSKLFGKVRPERQLAIMDEQLSLELFV